MERKSKLLWFVLLLSLSSCVSYEKFSIEVFSPAKFSIPADIEDVAIVSRNLKYANDTLQNYQNQNSKLVKDKVRFNADSLAITNCMDSLATKLKQSGKFRKVVVLPVNKFPQIRAKEIRPDKADWYSNLTKETETEGLILLDMYSSFYSNTFNNAFNARTADVVTTNIWTFYSGKSRKITDRFIQIDTLYWDGKDENGKYNKLKIPAKKEAFAIAGGLIGKNYSKHLLPSWKRTDRNIMVCNNPDIQNAARLAKKDKWEGAAVIWERNINSKNKRIKIASIYNLALSSEMNGDIDKALDLVAKAAEISSGAFRSDVNEEVRRYSAVLYRRKAEIQKLNLLQNESN